MALQLGMKEFFKTLYTMLFFGIFQFYTNFSIFCGLQTLLSLYHLLVLLRISESTRSEFFSKTFLLFSLKMTSLGVTLFGKSIAHIFEPSKCFPDPDSGYCIEAKMYKIRILTILLQY